MKVSNFLINLIKFLVSEKNKFKKITFENKVVKQILLVDFKTTGLTYSGTLKLWNRKKIQIMILNCSSINLNTAKFRII